MTITSQDARDEYTATAGQTIFNYTFKIYDATELDIYITPSGQEADDFADITTAYTVDPSTIENPNGGFITLDSGANSGDLITIVSGMPYNRTVDYQNSGDFLPDTVNGDNDRQVSQIKQVADLANRSVLFPQSLQNASSLSLPLPSAGLYLRWKGDLTGLENTGAPGVVIPSEVNGTASDMIADVTVSIGDFIITTGYSVEGDGGDNLYEVVAAATGTDDGGSFIDLTGSGHQAKGLFPSGLVKAAQFGAGIGGSDVAALANAITYAASVSATLEIQGGSYDLSSWSSQTLSSPLKIRGDSYDTVTFTGSGSNDFLDVDTVSFEMSGISFDAWGTVITPMDAGSPMNYSICGNKATNIDQFVTVPESTCNFDLFRFCDNIGDTISQAFCNLSCSAGTITSVLATGNTVSNVGTISSVNGIGLRFGHDSMVYGGSYIVSGNTFKTMRAAGGGISAGILIYNGKKVVVSNNTIEDVQNVSGPDDASGLYIKAEDGSNTSVTGNVFRDASLGTTGSISIKGGSGDVAISGNSISFPSAVTGIKNGITLSPKARTVSVTGNTVRDSTTPLVCNCGANISGNVFVNTAAGRAVQIFKSDGIPATVIVDNNIVDGVGLDAAITGTNVYGICSIENSTGLAQLDLNVVISNNNLLNVNQAITNKYGVWIRDVDAIGNVTISGNQMAGVDRIARSQGGAANIAQLVMTGNNAPDVASIGWLTGTLPNNALVKDNTYCEEYPYVVTDAQLNALADNVNTIGKREGLERYNTTQNKPVYAGGSADSDVWRDGVGATTNTPV